MEPGEKDFRGINQDIARVTMIFSKQSQLHTNNFFFAKLNSDELDALVIYNPPDAFEPYERHLHSTRSLNEHIALVNTKKIKKAIVIAEDISFLPRCTSLEYLSIIPSYSCRKFDFSPLYAMSELKWLSCVTTYGPDNKKFAQLDCSKLQSVRRLSVDGKQQELCLDGLHNLRSLFLHSGAFNHKDLKPLRDCKSLINLWFTQSSVCSLSGIEKLLSLKRLELDLCSKLEDISALASCAETLTWLTIDTCNKITDFTPLADLKNLEFLSIRGNNTLPNLSFLRAMPNLKSLFFTVKIQDGDLSLCEGIPDVRFVDRRHYSHKSKAFPQNRSIQTHLFYYENE